MIYLLVMVHFKKTTMQNTREPAKENFFRRIKPVKNQKLILTQTKNNL